MLTDLSIVIPCYNEVDNIHRLKEELSPVVEDLASYLWVEVIFVDDGSQDGTWDALIEAFGEARIDSLSFRFEKHVTNQGLGAAVRTGFRHCTGSVIVTTDSDGTYRFDTIPALLSCLTPDMDIVTASPYHPKGGVEGVPAYRLLLSRGSSFLYRVLVNPRMSTYTCLYRAYRRSVIQNLVLSSTDYLINTEILVKALLLGYRAAEHPAVLHVREYGVSKAKIMNTIISHLIFQGAVLLHRFGLRRVVDTKASRSDRKWA